MNGLIWFGLIIVLGGAVALIAIAKAPEGTQDEDGFHLGQKSK